MTSPADSFAWLTYYWFHVVFNLPLTLVLIFLARPYWERSHAIWMAVVLAIVFLFTSPWDNFAVMRGIWDFPEDKILFRVGWLPLEEYLFFVFESVNVMLLLVWWLGRTRRKAGEAV